MSFDDDFLSQEPYVYLSRIQPIEQSRTTRGSKRAIVESLDSESGSESSYRTNSKSKMSRPTRKRGSGEVEEPIVHTNKAKGGPLSVKKVKFGVNYDPDKDNLSFVPPNPDRFTGISVIIPPRYSNAVSDLYCFSLNRNQSKKVNVDNYCVLLRLAYFNKQDGNYEDIFDYGMDIRINETPLPLTAPTEDDPNAPLDGPADITRYLNADGNSTETVTIFFEGQAKPHVFSIILCKKKKEELPFVPMRYYEPNQTFKLTLRLNERFRSDPNKIFRKVYTLLDPISKQRIEIPIRGKTCEHVECFDKNTFLRANHRKMTWSCPICSKTIEEDWMIVDGLFDRIISKTFSSCTAVELDSQGGWSPIYREKVFRVRTIDLENDFSQGEDDEEEVASPEDPLSPVDVPPEPVEPELAMDSNEFAVVNGGGDELNVSRDTGTQTPIQEWTHNFEVEKGDDTPMEDETNQQKTSQSEMEADIMDRPHTSETPNSPTQTPTPIPSTVIQRIDDDENVEEID